MKPVLYFSLGFPDRAVVGGNETYRLNTQQGRPLFNVEWQDFCAIEADLPML